MHFDLTDWVDHARDLGDDATRKARQEHLDGSDDKSADFVDALRQVGSVMRADAIDPPPEESVRAAKLIPVMALRRPPTPAGPVDSADLGARHLPISGEAHRIRYQIDGNEIDLRVELRGSDPGTVIVGIITRLGPPLEAISGAPVHLLSAGETLASTLTNSFGELHIETNLETGLELRVLLSDRRRIDIPLPTAGIVEI